jgi:hypothetical protein
LELPLKVKIPPLVVEYVGAFVNVALEPAPLKSFQFPEPVELKVFAASRLRTSPGFI